MEAVHDKPLRGRVALVTGVGRRAGIGYAIARRLRGLGAELFLHRYGDSEQLEVDAEVDLAEADAPQWLMDLAVEAFGHVDILICNHARDGGDGALGELDADMLDAHWAINARSSIMLAQAFAGQHDGRAGGRVVFMTSGQDLGPMPNEVAYAASKGALASITKTLADQLADRGITLNAVNPGPVDTGYASAEVHERVRRRFPQGRWGTPDDPARLIAWLVGDEASWITGQVISTEGGFRRWD